MLDEIQHMSHTLRTVCGDYNLAYGGDIIPEKFRYFMMGLFQGNSSSPQIRLIIISVVLLELRAQGFAIHFGNYFTKEIAQFLRFSYIDDCDIVQLDDYVEATHSQMKLVIPERWGLIRITGGFPAPDKSAWYLVNYKWK